MERNDSSCGVIKTKIAHGNYTCVYKNNIVGVCTYPVHRGMVTKNVLKSHKCHMKKCRYFKKTNYEYWNLREPKKESSKFADYHKYLPDNFLFVQDTAKIFGYYIEVLAITELIDKYVIHYKNISENFNNDFTVLCDEISRIWDKSVEFREFESELELSQLIADSQGYEMTFTRHTIDDQKNHITLYYFSNKELDNLKELNVKLSRQLRLTVSFLADE